MFRRACIAAHCRSLLHPMSSGIFRTYRNLVVLGLRQRSCRNLIYVYALHIRACVVIRCRVSLQRLGSRSPRGHLAQENSARSHFEVAWPGKPQPEVTSESLGSRKLGSKSLRCRISMSLQSHFKVTSKSLGSRRLESRSLRSFEAMQKTIRENCPGDTEL